MTAADFEKISRLAYDEFGLHLPESKHELVEGRLSKEMRRMGAKDFGEYYRRVREDPTGEALLHLIDALTTHHTAFLREPGHFELLSSLATGQYRHAPVLRVWSAACSSGEEAYSIAMVLKRACAREQCAWEHSIQILATDISARVLEVARRGVYEGDRVAAIPQDWMRAFFLRGQGPAQGKFQMRPEVRGLVEFRRLNLMDALPAAEFEFIFCRNVMIYFDRATEQNILRRMAPMVVPGGYLFIGHSETLNGLDQPLKFLRPAVYRREARG